jgi:hypothetical protein
METTSTAASESQQPKSDNHEHDPSVTRASQSLDQHMTSSSLSVSTGTGRIPMGGRTLVNPGGGGPSSQNRIPYHHHLAGRGGGQRDGSSTSTSSHRYHPGPFRGGSSSSGGRTLHPPQPIQIHQNSGIPFGHVPAYLPGSASLVEQLDQRILIVLRDGKHLIGVSYNNMSVRVDNKFCFWSVYLSKTNPNFLVGWFLFETQKRLCRRLINLVI